MLRYVEKLRVPVRFALLGDAPVHGEFSLAPQAELHEGPETLLERLDTPQRILPFHRTADNSVVLVTRVDIAWVEAVDAVDPHLVRPKTHRPTREEGAHVGLLEGEVFDGVLAMEMPHEFFNRASDYLNGADDFFPLQDHARDAADQQGARAGRARRRGTVGSQGGVAARRAESPSSGRPPGADDRRSRAFAGRPGPR